MKENSGCNKRIISVFFILALLITTVTASTRLLKANGETSGYLFHTVKNNGNTTVEIVGDDSNVPDGIQINNITAPDGTVLDGNHVSYCVSQNDTYIFRVEFILDDITYTEDIPVIIDSLEPASAMTIGDLKAESQNRANSPISVPMYTDNKINFMGNYSFQGGNIENIADQTFEGLPYRFAKAEIEIYEGASLKAYPINFYDKLGDAFYYSIANTDGKPSDFDIAYEVPPGAKVLFYFELNTQTYPVTINDRQAEGFHLQFSSGIQVLDDGSLSARYSSLVKIELTYPAGYYTENAPEGKHNVGIAFSDESIQVTEVHNRDTRTINYTFTYPDKPMTLTIVGDQELSGLIYGVVDGTGDFQNLEQGYSWWKATDADGNYTTGDPYYGADRNADNIIRMRVIGGTPKDVSMNEKTRTIATGTFNSGQTLDFEYKFQRMNLNGRPPYFYWPSPVLSLNYFTNGTDYSTGTPITETFPLWDPSWKVDPSASPPDQPITNVYTTQNGATVTITVKKAVVSERGAAGGITLYPPDCTVHVKIENMKNSFYLKTQGSGSVQGPHYFREMDNISIDSIEDSAYYTAGDKEDGGAVTSEIKKRGLFPGGMFLDKMALFNQNIPGGNGVPWASNKDAFFKFEITPKWGYTYPRIESYDGKSSSPVMTNKPLELERQELIDKNPSTNYPALPYGDYSWFHPNPDTKNRSPFRYSLFMPVESLTTQHDMRAIDVKTDKITGVVTNNDAYPIDANHPNQIITGDGTFDLLANDRIIFSDDFQAPKREGETFVGFIAHITAPDNPLLPPDYQRTLYKDIAETQYFRPGDSINVSDYFRRDAEALLDTWNKKHSFTTTEQNRLAFFMYTQKMKVSVELIYKPGASAEGGFVTGYVNKYLQNVEDPSLSYLPTPADTKTVSMINGAHIVFNSFANSYLNATDGYTYYLNMDHTHSLTQVPPTDQEVAYVAYDRGLMVNYAYEDGSPFTGIKDTNVYKTYDGSNQAVIKFPTESQYPLGKAFDYWVVEELDHNGQWVSKPNVKIKESETPVTYDFSSGMDANNKTIRLKAIWRDITPDAYISIPKHILLQEKDTNLSPAKNYAGSKVTITYQSSHGSNKNVFVDVLKTFSLSLVNEPSKKITVKSYDEQGDPLTSTGINDRYARIGEFGKTSGLSKKDIWFNTDSLSGNEVYKGLFQTSSDVTDVGQGVLFYISAASP